MQFHSSDVRGLGWTRITGEEGGEWARGTRRGRGEREREEEEEEGPKWAVEKERGRGILSKETERGKRNSGSVSLER